MRSRLCFGLILLFYVVFCMDSVEAKKARKKKKVQTVFSGVTSSRLRWTQESPNVISAEIDISKHGLSAPPFVFTTLTSSKPKLNMNFDIDMSFLDDFNFVNMTGKTLPVGKATSKDSFTMKLSYKEEAEKNLTSSAANYGNYKVRYILYTRENEFEQNLIEKYEDDISSKDFHALAPLSYLNFLDKLFDEDKEVIKPLLGKDYAKPKKETEEKQESS